VLAAMKNGTGKIFDNLANRFFSRCDWIYVTVLFFSEGIKPDRISLLAEQFRRAPLTEFITEQLTLHLTFAILLWAN
jgi:hypothetical protein